MVMHVIYGGTCHAYVVSIDLTIQGIVYIAKMAAFCIHVCTWQYSVYIGMYMVYMTGNGSGWNTRQK